MVTSAFEIGFVHGYHQTTKQQLFLQQVGVD